MVALRRRLAPDQKRPLSCLSIRPLTKQYSRAARFTMARSSTEPFNKLLLAMRCRSSGDFRLFIVQEGLGRAARLLIYDR